MSEAIKLVLEDLESVFSVTESILEEYDSNIRLQVPVLVEMVATKLKLDEKQKRLYDPVIRLFLKKHPDWNISTGAKGGIERVSDKLNRENNKKQKAVVKSQLKAQIEAKAIDIITTPQLDVSQTPESDLDDL